MVEISHRTRFKVGGYLPQLVGVSGNGREKNNRQIKDNDKKHYNHFI